MNPSYDMPLTNDNFLLFSARYYNNRQNSTDEFYEDLRRFKYIRKLITRYKETGVLKERLILNHFVILNNVFGPMALCRMIFLKLKDQLEYCKPFLVFINILPTTVLNVNGKDHDTDLVGMDAGIVTALREMVK